MTNGAVTIDVPAGWTAPQLAAGAGQVTTSTGTISVASQTITVSSLSRNAGQTVTITYLGGIATTTAGAANWTSKQKSTAGGTLTNIGAQPSVTVNNAADGTGTMGVAPTTVLAGTANTETFTYTAPTGGMTNGAVTIDVPAGWTAPQLAAGAGQVTTSTGSISVAGQTITVDSLNRNAGQTVTITYAGGIATTTTGAANWTSKQKSTAGGTLTNIAAQPSVTVNNAADGSGTNTVTCPGPRRQRDDPDDHLHRSHRRDDQRRRHRRRARRLDCTAARRGRRPGHDQRRLDLRQRPDDHRRHALAQRRPDRDDHLRRRRRAHDHRRGQLDDQAEVHRRRHAHQRRRAALRHRQQRGRRHRHVHGRGTTHLLAGTATHRDLHVHRPHRRHDERRSKGHRPDRLDRAAARGRRRSGHYRRRLALRQRPDDHRGLALTQRRPDRDDHVHKRDSDLDRRRAVVERPAEVHVERLVQRPRRVAVHLGRQCSRRHRNNAVAPLTTLAGTATTETFTYTAATGGLTNGGVKIAVPAGWTAPQLAAGAGQATSSSGTVSVSGQTITVDSLTLAGAATATITYTNGVATTTTGSQTWSGQQKSTSGGSYTAVGASPSVNVTNAPDGSGTLTTGTSSVLAASSGNTITFTYTAATGGLSNGAVTVDVPAGWTAPQLAAGAGQATSSTGTVSVAGQTITVSSLTLAAGATATITYTNATASSTTGSQSFAAKEKSTSGGTLTSLATSPSVNVTNSADGSGTLTTPTSTVLAGSSGNTIVFTYTAATGGMSSGGVKVVVPAGWTAPQLAAGAGQATSSAGTVSVSGQTITVDSLTLAEGATATITYTNGTATSSVGSQSWNGQQRSTGGGSYTALAASPSISVDNAPHGSGTLTTSTNTVERLSTGNTVTFTYTAATGGLTSGAVTVDVPTGWSAPSTTGSANGYATSSAGTVSVAGRTITVASLTLAGGGTVTITYGSTASGGSGADAPSISGAQSWSAQQKSTSGGSLTNLAVSPSITVQDTTPPTFSSASVDGTSLTITLNEALDGSSTPAGSAFTVARNGSGMAAPTNVVVSGTTVTLTLAAPIRNGDTVTVAYAQPGTGRIKDIAGNDAASFGAQAVTNGTASLTPDVPGLVSPPTAAPSRP